MARPARRADVLAYGVSAAELRGPMWEHPYRGVVGWRGGSVDDVRWRICAAGQLLPPGGYVGG